MDSGYRGIGEARVPWYGRTGVLSIRRCEGIWVGDPEVALRRCADGSRECSNRGRVGECLRRMYRCSSAGIADSEVVYMPTLPS